MKFERYHFGRRTKGVCLLACSSSRQYEKQYERHGKGYLRTVRAAVPYRVSLVRDKWVCFSMTSLYERLEMEMVNDRLKL